MLVRTVTALVLIAVILPVLFFGSQMVVNWLALAIFAVACWEACRLFWARYALPITIIWIGIYLTLFYSNLLYQFSPLGASLLDHFSSEIMLGVGFIWLLLFARALKYGLPKRDGWLNTMFGMAYLIVIAACLLSINYLQWLGIPLCSEPCVDLESRNSLAGATFLLSTMSIVWAADIGAYLVGKAWGRHRLAPSISPGKTWEGVLGGWICVLIVGVICTQIPLQYTTIFSMVQAMLGWVGLIVALSFLTLVSVTGDLIESQLKRRAQIKNSSNLLPGHGGVLDRIDALIFVLPMTLLVVLAASWLPIYL